MIKNLKYYWLLTRPGNLGIVLLTQLLFIAHAAHFQWINIYFPQGLWMMIAVVLTAAAGYVINDIFDIEEDQINDPELRIVARHISVRNSYVFYGVLIAASLFFGFMSDLSMGFLCIAVSLLLFYYSSDLKGSTLWGNLLVSFITGAVVFTASRGVGTRFHGYFAEYALFAFLISMAREIVKDAEDIEGDKVQEYRTVPIVYGVRKAMLVATFFVAMQLSAVVYLMMRHGNNGYNIYCSIFVLLPSVIVVFLLSKAKEKKQFTFISTWLKLLMISGLCSVLWL